MNKKPHKDWTADERAEVFHERYGEDVDAGTTLVDLVKGCGVYLARIVGEETASAAMAPVIESLDFGPVDPANWTEALDDASACGYSSWPTGAELHDLTAYAIYGIVLGDGDERQRQSQIRTMIDNAGDLLAASPVTQWNLNRDRITELETLVLLAKNRWALDNKSPVEPAAVAWFGGLSERSIRNMMAGPGKTFSNEEGGIPAHEALAWLESRESFWNSIWRDQTRPRVKDPDSPVEDPVFVPIARDGSVFHPGIRRKNGFTVGEKGNERQFADFELALEELHKMPVPYWRRPNQKDIFGIVRGVRWERFDRNYLEAISKDRTFKLPAMR